MKIIQYHLLACMTACFLVFAFSKLSFAAPTPLTINDLLKADLALVESINFSAQNNVNIVLSKKAENFKAFTLSKPHRLVIDIKNANFANDDYTPVLPSFVKSFRSSLDSDNNLRLVFDLKNKLAIKKSIFQKDSKGTSGKIVTQFSKDLKGGKFPVKKYYQIAKKVIVIDAGHGGKDPGTIGRYGANKEKDITLAYAKELKKRLDQTKKYKTYLTRDKDYFIPLRGRVEKARKLKANLFISLHANSIDNRNISGFSIYTLSKQSSDKQAALLAKKENRADIIAGVNFSGASKDVMNTLIDLSQRDSMNNSSQFANIAISRAKKSRIQILQNTHRFAGFAVLTAPDMASVLIELGYLSNKYEEKRLKSYAYRVRIAKSLVIAVNQYFAKIKN